MKNGFGQQQFNPANGACLYQERGDFALRNKLNTARTKSGYCLETHKRTTRERQRDNTMGDYDFSLHLNQFLKMNKAIYRSGFGAALRIM